MPTRRVFVKRVAATTLFFGAGVQMTKAASDYEWSGTPQLCVPSKYQRSGKWYCKLQCDQGPLGSSCGLTCVTDGVENAAGATVTVDGPPSAILSKSKEVACPTAPPS
jgi:hypothetical protein